MPATNSALSISAVIPSCDRPHEVRDAALSALTQTVRPVDVVVVDNGAERIDARTLPEEVTLVELEPYAGVPKARNAGAYASRGDYIAFLDDDDTWAPDYLAAMHAAIGTENRPDFLIGRRDEVIGGTRVVKDSIKNHVDAIEDLMPMLLFRNVGIGGQNIVVQRDAFQEVGGFDEELPIAEDRAIVVDLMKAGKRGAYVPDAAAVMGETQEVRITGRAQKAAERQSYFAKYEHMMEREVWLKAKMYVVRSEARESASPFARLWTRGKHLLLRVLLELHQRASG